jgi:penicillin-binding protein 1A
MKIKQFIIKNLKRILFLLSIVITILVGALIGIILVYQKGFPQIKRLEEIKPKIMTVIYDDQGKPIKEFAIEKRTIVQRSDIPEVLEKALIASEDNQFYSHWGINFKGTLRAILGEIIHKDLGGGSSITQQLALNLFLNRERTWSRKLKEMLMAIQIEKKYSKDQILTFYCNKIYLGASVYGVEAASKYYFGKSVKNINLAEAALIPTIMPSPNGKYHVFNQPQNCLKKRNYILKRMLDLEFIDEKQYKEAIKFPLPKKPFDMEEEEIGNYFVEEIRKLIESKFGDKQLYTGGLKVYTTLNSEMQIWAEESLREGLRTLDKRKGWHGNLENLLKNNNKNNNKKGKKIDIETVQLPSWKYLQIKKGEIFEGIVLKVSNRRAVVRIGEYKGILKAADAKWAKRTLSQILKKGDVTLVKILEIPEDLVQPTIENESKTETNDNDNDNDKKKNGNINININMKDVKYLTLSLEQEPDVQGAILVVDNKTGEIKAMMGGYSFEKSKWNNATQAKRQTGSTIKPIVYTAAIENGYTPATIIVDEPTIFDNEWTQEPYEPQNHTEDFRGPLTLRRGFELSVNLISAKIVEYLTPPRVVQYARKFGITADLKPYMSIALGAFEVTLKEMVAAYTVFPNLGFRVNPYFIKKIIDQNNYIIDENFPDKKQVVEKETAYIINYLMQGVVKSGSGYRARHLEAPIGGKTGTTDDCTDAWFIGFSPSITVGVWVGHDVKRSLGYNETGGRAASPIFVSFMEKYLEKHPEPKEFKRPSGVIMVKIDKYTGKLFTEDCLYPFQEAFIKGTEPLEYCSEEDHLEINDYYHGEPLSDEDQNEGMQ